jgi:hypothetical protein
MRLLAILLGLLRASGASAQDLDQQDLKHALGTDVLTEEAINHLAKFPGEAVEIDSQMPLMPPGLLSSRQVSVDAMVALMNAHPPLKALLAKHHLTARDALLMPSAYLQGALLLKAPPDMLPALAAASGANLANLPLLRARGDSLEVRMTRARAGLVRVFPQP